MKTRRTKEGVGKELKVGGIKHVLSVVEDIPVTPAVVQKSIRT